MTEPRHIPITLPVLARVEGEGALELHVHGGKIEDLRLRIFEPPRLFEKFLEGRDCFEVPDMVARICGICPVAYQMSAVNAIESAFGIKPTSWIRAMRRVMYCGEWIESHSLHIHMLAAPDFLGFPGLVEMAKEYPDEVRRGLRLQALGNELIRLLGGRSVHPVGVRIGGFHRVPGPEEINAVLDKLRAAVPEAEALLHWTASLDFPDDGREFICVALRHPDEYPLVEGRLVSTRGLDITADDFEKHFVEHQVPHSTALHCLLEGRPYLVGPLARLNLNRDRLPSAVRAQLETLDVGFPSVNMHHSIVARAIEILVALNEAIRLLELHREPQPPCVQVTPRASSGMGWTEAPRGILWHRYEMDAAGRITRARIVPPTSQNQTCIEEDLRQSLEKFGLDRPEHELRHFGERVIRNYDPCISCATHFLDLRIRRRE